MHNRYEVDGDVVVIYLKHRKKGQEDEIVRIDLSELPTALGFKGSFFPFIHHRTKKMYARGYYMDPITGKIDQPLLHRLIMKPTRGENTAHISEDTLLCTRSNMRNVVIGTNHDDVKELVEAEREALRIMEQEAAAATAGEAENETFLVHETTTAWVWLPDLASLSEGGLKVALEELKAAGAIEKGVSFHKHKRRWEVSAFADGVRHRLGYWSPADLQLANEAVRLFRALGPADYFAGHEKGGS